MGELQSLVGICDCFGWVPTIRGSLSLDLINDANEILGDVDKYSVEVKNYKDLRSFLNAMTLGSNEFGQGDGVNLLSVHASKGLEFDCVFVVDLMDGRFPNHKLASKSGGIEEERRLFYVALTRAREHLYLSFALQDSTRSSGYKPSTFLFEAELLCKDDFN